MTPEKRLALLTSIGYHRILEVTNARKEHVMKVIYCDVCKKAIDNPIPTRNYFQIANKDLCEPCKDDLELALKSTMRTKTPFDFGWNDELTMKLIQDGMAKGRIETKAKR
jgi:hypothetical protein